MVEKKYVITIDEDVLGEAGVRLNDDDHAGRNQHSDPEQPFWNDLARAITWASEVEESQEGGVYRKVEDS